MYIHTADPCYPRSLVAILFRLSHGLAMRLCLLSETMIFITRWVSLNKKSISQLYPQPNLSKNDTIRLTDTGKDYLLGYHLCPYAHYPPSQWSIRCRDGRANNCWSSWAEPKWLEAWFAGAELSPKAQVWYCSSRAEPKSSNLILIELSHKLEFSKPSGWAG